MGDPMQPYMRAVTRAARLEYGRLLTEDLRSLQEREMPGDAVVADGLIIFLETANKIRETLDLLDDLNGLQPKVTLEDKVEMAIGMLSWAESE